MRYPAPLFLGVPSLSVLALRIPFQQRFDEFWTRPEIGLLQAIQRDPQVRKSVLGSILLAPG
jgi:hypothetical protein